MKQPLVSKQDRNRLEYLGRVDNLAAVKLNLSYLYDETLPCLSLCIFGIRCIWSGLTKKLNKLPNKRELWLTYLKAVTHWLSWEGNRVAIIKQHWKYNWRSKSAQRKYAINKKSIRGSENVVKNNIGFKRISKRRFSRMYCLIVTGLKWIKFLWKTKLSNTYV